jgi:ribosomal protein S18 acetylase RimI-like enzyme
MSTYTPYKPHHHTAVERLGEETFDNTYIHEFRAAVRDADPKSIVVLNNRQVVGFALLRHTRMFRYLDTIELAYLVVHPDFQGKQIGSTLLQKVKMMSPNVILEVAYDNPAAERLYRRHGFETWRHLYTKANGGYLLGWSKQRHELMPRLRSHQSLPADGITAPSTTHRP